MISLLAVSIRSWIAQTIEEWKVRRHYYNDSKFHEVDQAFVNACDPFMVSRQYLQSKGEKDPYQYGETPLTTMDKIAKEFEIDHDDRLVEVGCGLGRCAYFLSHFFGCQVVGVEQIDFFVTQAKGFVEEFQLERLQYQCGDFFQFDLSKATILYLYQTMLSESEITQFCAHIAPMLSKGTKVITVSYPLHDYDDRFRVDKQIRGEFLFGKADVYLNRFIV